MDHATDVTERDIAVAGAASRSLPRDTVWFASGTIAGKAVALISLPIFARLLGPADFGRLDVLNALISAGLATFMVGTDVAVTRLYFDADSQGRRRRLLATWLAMVGGIAVITSGVLIVSAERISVELFGAVSYTTAVSLVGVILFVGLIHAAVLVILRTLGRPRAYGLLEGAALVFNAGLATVLLIGWRADTTSVLLALAISWTLAAVVGLLLVRTDVTAGPTLSAARRLLVLGLPLAPAIAGVLIGDFLNRSVLLGVGGPEQAGYLSIAIRLGSISGLVVAAVQLAWQPHAYRLGSSAEAVVRLTVEGRQIIVGTCLLVMALIAVAPEMIALLGGPGYSPAGPAASWAIATTAITALYLVATLPLAMARATGRLAWSAIGGVVVAVLLNVVLATRFGSSGTAAAMFVGQGTATMIGANLARRYPGPRPWDPRLATIISATLGTGLISAIAWELPVWVRLGMLFATGVIAWREGILARVAETAREVPSRHVALDESSR